MIPKPKSTDRQHRLFADPIGNHGHVRTILGSLTERLTAYAFNGKVLRTDSRCEYCPDIEIDNDVTLFAKNPSGVFSSHKFSYIECKAMGRSNQTFIYEGRLEKDLKFHQAGNSLVYVIWRHSIDSSQYKFVHDLECAFLMNIKGCFCIPFNEVYTIAKQVPPTKLNSKYGHSDSNPTYGAGYRISLKSIQESCHAWIKWEAERKEKAKEALLTQTFQKV